MGKEPIEFAEKALGFIHPAKAAVDMSQEGDRESFAREVERLLKNGNRFGAPALAPGRPPEHEMCVQGFRKQFEGPPGLNLRLSVLTNGEIYPRGRRVREERSGVEPQRILDLGCGFKGTADIG